MSSPAVAGETRLKELLGALDKDLVTPMVVAPPVAVPEGAPMTLTLQDAVLTGLERNQSFNVERLEPAISRTGEEVELAAFDPALTGSASQTHGQETGGQSSLRSMLSNTGVSDDAETTRVGLGLSQATTLGATVALNVDEAKQKSDVNDSSVKLGSWDLTVTQALLQGRGPSVTLARLRQSRLDTEMSLYEVQGAAEALVSQIEQGYWDVVLAGRSLDIYEQSLAIARQQVEEVVERIKVGVLAESEAAAAESEAAARAEQLVTAKGILVKARLNLLRMVNPAGPADWQAVVVLPDVPELPPDMALDGVESHVSLALAKRPDLNQARLQVRRRDLDVVQTRNGLLPKLDLFVSLGGSRYTQSVSGTPDETDNQKAYAGGLTLELPLGNRAAKARHAAAGWSLDQAGHAMANMEQLVQVDVRSAYVDVEQFLAQVKAAEATRVLREKTFAIEQEKFRLGRSTTLLVAQAQRDMVASQIGQAEAVIGVRKALTSLYRLEGSLLSHRGVIP
ncbi:MAG: TolC family protein [Proteobacteria bacterium]|nr:TolC family protein [Pseudomonadota bacterium]